jgi:phage tail sheath protein FI
MSAIAPGTPPGVEVTTRAVASTAGDSGDTGRAFMVGITEKGPVDQPVLLWGHAGYQRAFGDRTHYTTLSDPASVAFELGLAELVVSRVVGPGATVATVTLQDRSSTPQDTLTIEAVGPGDWANSLHTVISDDGGSAYQLEVADGDPAADGEVLERYRNLATVTDAVDALANSRYVRGTDAGSTGDNPTPATGTSQLAGGDDDRANITTSEWTDALDRIERDWGPGQVMAPGQTDSAVLDAVVAHAEQSGQLRVAVLDTIQGAALADLQTAGQRDTSHATVVGYWGRTQVDGRRTAIPGSALLAGLIARRDADNVTAHQAAAGVNYGRLSPPAGPISELIQADLPDSERGDLNRQGVLLAREHRAYGVHNYGWRSLAKPPLGQPESPWADLSAVRYRMSLTHRGERLAERFLFRSITSRLIARFGNALEALLLGDWEAGALYGDAPEDAFTVDVGDDVNPPENVASGLLSALVLATFSRTAERVRIEIVKQRID